MVADVLVLAGDVIPVTDVVAAREVFGLFCEKFPTVVFVPGNHELYGTDPASATAVLEVIRLDNPNLRILDPGVAEVEGERIVGAPLWFPELPGEEPLRAFLSDFSAIRDFLPWGHAAHDSHLRHLGARQERGDVVVTHHLPHPACVSPRFRGSALNRFFVAEDASPLVELGGASVWIHGHTHDSVDVRVGETRVVCNPRGYPDERTPRFDPEFVVEA